MKEVRRIRTEAVRSLCIEHDYYTAGTCEEYTAMFDLCRTENPTTQDFEEIALNIYSHSNTRKMKQSTGLDAKELIKCIVFELINDCTTVYIED